MEEGGKTLVRHQLVLLSVGSYLVSVHADHGNLDRAAKVEVVVAQVVGGGLKAILRHS